jgi:serine-type D-Ala-D-Ala carboxypeptidase/endopeptidase (penicillin-binding protein 4)
VLRIERDPVVRVMAAEALYKADREQGGGALLEALTPGTDVFARLRAICKELSLPIPAVSSLLDLAVDGSAEALVRLLAIAPLARGAQRDVELESALADGLDEVADASPEELTAAMRSAPPAQAKALLELLAIGLADKGTDPGRTPLARLLRSAKGAEADEAQPWLAVLEQRPERPPQPTTPPAGAAAVPPGSPAAVVLEAAAAAKADPAVPGAAPPATFPNGEASPAAAPGWPVTNIPNPAWSPRSRGTGSAKSASPLCPRDASRCPPDGRPGG